MSRSLSVCLLVLCVALAHAYELWDEDEPCAVSAQTSAGWVCGALREDAYGGDYASFRGVPYAEQPLGELRFQELQPPEPWEGVVNATVEGPVCPQTDILYGAMMQPQGMSESCIHANIHVPLAALPANGTQDTNATAGLPIFVFIHGGAYAFGSGDADVYGPEYLVANDVIVITFNYRLNVFGFLSLATDKVPGNNGLRDAITLLRWVRQNARYFGGDPDDVTLGGQSAGASAAHLLTLSPLAEGLFNKAVIMSGTGFPSYYTASPDYAEYMASLFLASAGITATDPDEQYQALVALPLETVMLVNSALQDAAGLAVFFPVVDGALANVSAVLPDDPKVLMENGNGYDIPLLLGYTSAESEVFRNRLEEIGIADLVNNNSLLALSPDIVYNFPTEDALEKAELLAQRYTQDSDGTNGTWTTDRYIRLYTDGSFAYAAYTVADYRMRNGSAPTYLYEFSYSADSSVKTALNLTFSGGGHVEDMTYVFQTNSVDVPDSSAKQAMTELMTDYVTSFMRTGCPTCGQRGICSWQPVNGDVIQYQNIQYPICERNYQQELTDEQVSMTTLYDYIFSNTTTF